LPCSPLVIHNHRSPKLQRNLDGNRLKLQRRVNSTID
jgi:hypothetical protein